MDGECAWKRGEKSGGGPEAARGLSDEAEPAGESGTAGGADGDTSSVTGWADDNGDDGELED
jgi:hypothetical protein